ncbi:hypothetical protein F4803DRAFT_564495 [Xylaria telfairii]|nr:hypothetical protein F4803DRAFT_564495 [Xylaria telfairii]
MAQPNPRAQALTHYFSNEYNFEPENYIAGVILYKRRNAQGVVERIVVKHAVQPLSGQMDRDEENFLRRLWGSEHTIRLISVIDDRDHRAPVTWAEPLNRNLLNPPPILPWKLRVDPVRYPNAAGVAFFVMEYLERGTGDHLIERCQAMNIVEISEPLLWSFFLCLTRACVGMAYPPNRRNRNPPAVEREALPRGRPRPAPKGVQVIDFGMTYEYDTPPQAQMENMRFVGELMHQLACVAQDEVLDDEYKPRYLVRNVPGLGDFETYASEDFWRDQNLSFDFKLLVSRCMAVNEAIHPTVAPVLEICERNVGLTPNWMNLADEVSEIFDTVPLDEDSDSGSEYEP